MITLAFSHADDMISRLICWLTRSRVSHVALVSPDGQHVIEASGVGEPLGVRLISRERFLAERQGVEFRTLAHPRAESVWAIAWGQIGKGYDNSYLWGWLLHRNWQDPSRWVCQELIVWAAAQTGYPMLDMTDSHFLTPGDLYRISKPLE